MCCYSSTAAVLPATALTDRVFLGIRVTFTSQATTIIESGECDLDAGDAGGQTPCHIACYRVRDRNNNGDRQQ